MRAKRAAADAYDATPSPQAATAGAPKDERALFEAAVRMREGPSGDTPGYPGETPFHLDQKDAAWWGWKVRAALRASTPAERVPLSEAQREEVEAVIACLGDDAAQLREDNPEDERAENMETAATLLELAFGIVTKESST
jgi:hypothetical protein